MKLNLKRLVGIKPKESSMSKVEDVEGLRVTWKCSCGAKGQWHPIATSDSKLQRYWGLHLRSKHIA